LRVVALARVAGAVEQGVDGLVAFQVEKADGLPGPDLEQVGLAGRDDMAEAGGGGVLVAGGEAHGGGPQIYRRSVLWKPRPFSGREVRHSTVMPSLSTRCQDSCTGLGA